MVKKATNYFLSLDGLNCVVGPHLTRQFLDCQQKILQTQVKTTNCWAEKRVQFQKHEKVFSDFL